MGHPLQLPLPRAPCDEPNFTFCVFASFDGVNTNGQEGRILKDQAANGLYVSGAERHVARLQARVEQVMVASSLRTFPPRTAMLSGAHGGHRSKNAMLHLQHEAPKVDACL